MKQVKAIQSFAAVWGNKTYTLTEGEERALPDELADSVTRGGKLAVLVEDEAKPTRTTNRSRKS